MKGKRNECKRTKHFLHDVAINRYASAISADTCRLYCISHIKAMAEAQQKERTLPDA